MELFGYALTRMILLAAVVMALKYSLLGVYSLAAMFWLSLVVYGYLIRFGGRPIERRLFGRPGPPQPPEQGDP